MIYVTTSYDVLHICTLEVNKEMLIRSGFMDQFGKERLFPSIEDAVRFATEGKKAVSYTYNIIILFINLLHIGQSIQIGGHCFEHHAVSRFAPGIARCSKIKLCLR